MIIPFRTTILILEKEIFPHKIPIFLLEMPTDTEEEVAGTEGKVGVVTALVALSGIRIMVLVEKIVER